MPTPAESDMPIDVFVDYSGKKRRLVDASIGEARELLDLGAGRHGRVVGTSLGWGPIDLHDCEAPVVVASALQPGESLRSEK